MRALGVHPHILGLIGYADVSSGPVLIMEYCAGGDLLRYLRSEAKLVNISLLSNFARLLNVSLSNDASIKTIFVKRCSSLHGRSATAW